mmetsp:Transcript_22742/g.49270  ORF Transcript_22742/g.49270 Transcript_22742/m.49270 type:complete len:818 (+) Transcript_22742:461-2914(+)
MSEEGETKKTALRFDIVKVTSEDPNHLATELLNLSTLEDGKGWVSGRSPQCPQDVVLKLQPASKTIYLSSVNLLALEYFIPEKIDIIVASNDGGPLVESIDECSWVRQLGHVELCPGKESNYTARELKSVQFGTQEAAFVKLRLFGCHRNELNMFDQVGIAGIELFGSIVEKPQQEKKEVELHVEEKEEDGDEEEAEATDVAEDEEDEDKAGGEDEDEKEYDGDDDGHEEEEEYGEEYGEDGGDEEDDEEVKSIGTGDVDISPKPDCEPEDVPDTVTTSTQPAVSSPPPLTAQELLEKKARSREEINQRLDRLERMKRERAEVEDFECAAKIKDYLDGTKTAFSKLNDLEIKMKQASDDEDYAEAARIKQERDAARVAVMTSLDSAESTIADICGLEHLPAAEPTPKEGLDEDAKGASTRTDKAEISNKATADLCGQDEEDRALSRTEQGGKGETHAPHTNGVRTPPSRKESTTTDQGDDDDSLSAFEDIPEARDEFDEENHPLRGVHDFMAMAAPEEIKNENGEIASETIARIESLLGNYLTRCFFSTNYSLREAALGKVSLLLPELSSGSEGVDASNKDYLRTICMMLERAIDDRVHTVFMTSLVLLDNCLLEFQKHDMSSRDAISHLSMIVQSLVRHLGDNKAKVVEGAETTLMSLALCDCIGPTYVANQITKRTQDMKAGRAIISRMKVVKELMDEFGGGGGIRVEVLMDFVSEHGMRHKDAEVREAAKDVALSASKIIGRNIERYLDGLSDRQRKVILNSAIKAETGEQSLSHRRYEEEEDDGRHAMQMPTNNPPLNHELTEYPQPQQQLLW